MAIPLQAVLAAIFIHTLWGANTVAVKFGLLAFPPLWSAFIRFGIGVLCVWVWARASRIDLRPEGKEWLGIALCSAMFTLQIGLMNWGVLLTTASNAAVLMATYPLFMASLAHFAIARDRLSAGRVAGLTICFLGVCVVLLPGADFGSGTGWGDILVLVSAMLLGWRMVLTANLVQGIEPVRVIFWQMLLSLPVFAGAAAVTETIAWQNLDWKPAMALAYQGIVIAGFGFVITTQFLKLYRPSVMTSFGFIAPVSGVALSNVLLSEPLTVSLAVALAAVGCGLVLIARNDNKR